MLIDTHSHIYSEEFDEDRDEVIARAETAGISIIFLPAIDKNSYRQQGELVASRPDLFRQMMGLHPTSVNANYESDLALAHKLLFQNPDAYIGVGEIGIDLYWDTTFRGQQLDALEQQIGWAEELDKPVSLHLRNGKEKQPDNDAYSAIFKLLEQHGSPHYNGVMHCFSGTISDACRAIEMGLTLGIGGVLTYKKSTLPDIVRAIPLEHLILETDSPYLAPVPHRGQRNESAYMVEVARKIAEIKNIDIEEVAKITTRTVQTTFNI